MDLEAWRITQELTYDRLADLMGVKSASQMRRLCLGEELLRDERLATAMRLSQGQVTAYAVHEKRMAYLRSRPGGVGPHVAGPDLADEPPDSLEGRAA